MRSRNFASQVLNRKRFTKYEFQTVQNYWLAKGRQIISLHGPPAYFWQALVEVQPNNSVPSFILRKDTELGEDTWYKISDSQAGDCDHSYVLGSDAVCSRINLTKTPASGAERRVSAMSAVAKPIYFSLPNKCNHVTDVGGP
jgi:hypothetical protein